MKIKLSKKKGHCSIRFHAETDQEAVDLKDLVLGFAKAPSEGNVIKAVENLARRGYQGGVTKETRNTQEFTISRAEAS